jgi:heterotetrameric sarcosine oxidase gamma subunit
MSRYAATIRRLEMAAIFEARGDSQALRASLAAAALVPSETSNRFVVGPFEVEVWRIGPRRVLVRAPAVREAELERALGAAFATTTTAAVAMLSDLYVGFEIAGSGAIDVLKQGMALDLRAESCPVGFAGGTDLWGVAVVLARHEPGRFTVLVDRAHAGYLETWFAAAMGAASGPRPGTMQTPPASWRPA